MSLTLLLGNVHLSHLPSKSHLFIKCTKIYFEGSPFPLASFHLSLQFVFILDSRAKSTHQTPTAFLLNIPNWQRTQVSISSKPVFILTIQLSLYYRALVLLCMSEIITLSTFPKKGQKCKGNDTNIQGWRRNKATLETTFSGKLARRCG